MRIIFIIDVFIIFIIMRFYNSDQIPYLYGAKKVQK